MTIRKYILATTLAVTGAPAFAFNCTLPDGTAVDCPENIDQILADAGVQDVDQLPDSTTIQIPPELLAQVTGAVGIIPGLAGFLVSAGVIGLTSAVDDNGGGGGGGGEGEGGGGSGGGGGGTGGGGGGGGGGGVGGGGSGGGTGTGGRGTGGGGTGGGGSGPSTTTTTTTSTSGT